MTLVLIAVGGSLAVGITVLVANRSYRKTLNGPALISASRTVERAVVLANILYALGTLALLLTLEHFVGLASNIGATSALVGILVLGILGSLIMRRARRQREAVEVRHPDAPTT